MQSIYENNRIKQKKKKMVKQDKESYEKLVKNIK